MKLLLRAIAEAIGYLTVTDGAITALFGLAMYLGAAGFVILLMVLFLGGAVWARYEALKREQGWRGRR